LTPILYLLARNWVQVIPALLVNGVTSIYMPAFNAIIADSLPEEERGAGYGAYRMITSTPMIFSPVIGGILMDMYGYLEGVRIFLMFSIFINLIVTIVRWRVISETLTDDDIDRARQTSGKEKTGLTGQVKEKLDLPRTIWIMVVVAILGSIGQRMVMDFLPLYAVEQIGITNTQLGLVRTVSGIITAALAMPGGMISDRFGRKPMILLSRTVTPLSQIIITFAKNFPQYIMIEGTRSLADALGGGGRGGGGGGVGGPAWQALIADIVPREKRATTMGTIGTMTGIVSAPATMLGSYLWSTISPATTFHAAAVFGLLSSIIFALGVKEKREKPVQPSSKP
jgi:MFS family permease